MSRWLLLVCCVSVLGAVSSFETTRAPDAQPLGGPCVRDHECQLGLSCVFTPGVMEGQCTASCNETAACTERFGSKSMCLGADLCARTCHGDADCAQGSRCNAYGWCEAPVR